MSTEKLEKHMKKIIDSQYQRIEKMKEEKDFIDYTTLRPIVVGLIGGDGIGPYITEHTYQVLKVLLQEEINAGKIVFRTIDGLTIENRVQAEKAIPDDVLQEIKACHVLLKGPTTTPRAGDKWKNIESANVAMRRELDLFANIRPVRVPEEGIDWVFYRENTEGSYILGSQGICLDDELCIDFTVTTKEGSDRILRAAFDYASKSGKNRVTAVTKANIIKATDGKFLEQAKIIAKEYPAVVFDDWYVDIMAAKLLDTKRRDQFKVIVLPNLYGDILTDEAAELQGGVGTAGSANVGKKYAMFEAIHGSAPRMVEEGRAAYADPSSMMRAAVMMLEHIGFTQKAKQLSSALDQAVIFEKKVKITGREDGATSEEFSEYVMSLM